MESQRIDYIEEVTCDAMRLLGAATRHLCESFYYIAPFLRPEKTSRIKPMTESEPLAKVIKHSDIIKESTAASFSEDLSFVEPMEKTSQKPAIEESYNEEDINVVLKGVKFESKLEQLRAEMIIKNFQASENEAQAKVLEQLKKISKPTAIEILEKLLLTEKIPLRIIEILDIISGFNENCVLEKKVFKGFLKHSYPRLRQAAIRALTKYRDEESFSIISSCIIDEDAETRRQVLNYLSWFFSSQCTAVILKSLHDVDNQVRKSAIFICGTLKLRQSAPALIALLSDCNENIQREAVFSLRKISGKYFGFKLSGQARSNKAAINKWFLWWQDNRKKS